MKALTALVLFAGAAPALAAPPTYTATILPQLDTTNDKWSLTYTTPFGMNNTGQVTGDLGDGRGFVWSSSGSSDLVSMFGGSADRAIGTDINDHGAIVGSFTPSGQFQSRPYYFSGSGELTVLPTLVDGLGASANALNNAGMIVGSAERASGGTFGGPSSSVFWRDGQIHEIGGLGGDVSLATGVNENGVVTGYSNAANQQPVKAYRWTEAGGFEVLESFISNMPALATDINDNGVVVGHAGLSFQQNTAVYWDEDGHVHELGRTDEDSIDIDVRALNNDNIMVGMELVSSDFTFQARLWMDGQVYDLNDLVTGLPDGFVLADARDINESGQIIVDANAVVNGQIQFFSVLLTPVPAPGATALLAMGGLLGARRRR